MVHGMYLLGTYFIAENLYFFITSTPDLISISTSSFCLLACFLESTYKCYHIFVFSLARLFHPAQEPQNPSKLSQMPRFHSSYCLSIFSCVCWPSVCFLWRESYLRFLPIFWLDCLFFFFDIELYEIFNIISFLAAPAAHGNSQARGWIHFAPEATPDP